MLLENISSLIKVVIVTKLYDGTEILFWKQVVGNSIEKEIVGGFSIAAMYTKGKEEKKKCFFISNLYFFIKQGWQHP